MDLFSDTSLSPIIAESERGKLIIFPNWISNSECDHLFNALEKEIGWQSEEISMFGRTIAVPRKVAWHGDPGANYRYSGVNHEPQPWLQKLLELRERLEKEFMDPVNSVLCNLYRDGHDSMGWHSDNEPELGQLPTIYSISLGATRYFDIRLKENHREKRRFELASGNLLIMKGAFQKFWEHQVPKQKKNLEPRINLTFRNIRSYQQS
ncbi:alpha-ketoglutarate-dependent dioxygenase AlkB family protein [Pleionea sediminis]|uniref:alpha-ketoglutarate-dependent dioxygenase AlkB family protein n=1 Tax=Pleionea sediminis TaxID=2569479 RepID=UPI0011867DF0|nr:alpha-ketoglutarate-dependent dioxygenase AlkB [Pleionea sediminis]